MPWRCSPHPSASTQQATVNYNDSGVFEAACYELLYMRRLARRLKCRMNPDVSFLWSRLPAWALPPVPSNATLWQLTWILWESDQRGVEGNQASAPAGRGAILRAWLRRRSSGSDAASQRRACCCPRTTVPLSGSAVPREGTLPRGWESEQMHATVRQPLTPPGMWYILHYHCCSLSEERRSVFFFVLFFKLARVSAKRLSNPPPSFTARLSAAWLVLNLAQLRRAVCGGESAIQMRVEWRWIKMTAQQRFAPSEQKV